MLFVDFFLMILPPLRSTLFPYTTLFRSLAESELRDGAAEAALDPLRPVGDLVVALALAPLLRPVGVSDGHSHDGDRSVDAAERHDARNPASGADDHLSADLLAQYAVRRADVAP